MSTPLSRPTPGRPAHVLHVCTAAQRGPKSEIARAALRAGHGLVGDVHAGPGPRQVSLLDIADIESMRARGLVLAPGAFGENLVLEGVAVVELGIGDELQIGTARLRITRIGKVCHQRCQIYYRTGDCIMPRRGVFAEVITGGEVCAGQPVWHWPAATGELQREHPALTLDAARAEAS